MSETTPQQDVMPDSMGRLCSHCDNPISFLDHISIIGKRKYKNDSFTLTQLDELWTEFQNLEVQVFCYNCYSRFKYNMCECNNFRHTKKFIIHDKEGIPISFIFCRQCSTLIFGIDFDRSNEFQPKIKVGRKK